MAGWFGSSVPVWARQLAWFQAETLYKIGVIVSEVQDAVDAVVVELGKAKGEIVSKIADLEGQIAAGVTPDLTALKAAAQALDDVVPDPVVVPPVEPPVVPPVEPPVVPPVEPPVVPPVEPPVA